MKTFVLISSLFFFFFLQFVQSKNLYSESSPKRKTLTAEPLIWLKINADKDSFLLKNAVKIIRVNEIGGIIFNGHNAKALINDIKFIKENSGKTILSGISCEESPGKQFLFSDYFPSLATIAAITDPDLQAQTIELICQQLKTLGLQFCITDFEDGETFKNLRSLFLKKNIILFPEEKYLFTTPASPLYISGKLKPCIFEMTENAENEIQNYLAQIKNEYGNKLKKDNSYLNYTEKIKSLRVKTAVENTQQSDSSSILSPFLSTKAKVTGRKACRYSSIILKNEDNIIPILELNKKRIACISFSQTQKLNTFQKIVEKYTRVDCYNFSQKQIESNYTQIIDSLKKYNLIIWGIDSNSPACKKIIDSVNQKCTTISCWFYPALPERNQSDAILFAPDNDSISQSTASQILFGGISAKAQLPFATAEYPEGSGLHTRGEIRFEYTIPEMAGIDSDYLSFIIDSVANMAIEKQAFPGCQVLVAKDRKIVCHQSFGYHTYFRNEKVKNDDIYDLASVTKITGTLPAIMQFVDQKKIRLDENFSAYWPGFKNTNKENLKVREILAHQAGLQAWIPYWRSTVDENGNFLPNIFRAEPNDTFSVQVTRHLFMNKNYRKIMFQQIDETPVSDTKKYLYSGLPFYIFPEIIKNFTHEDYPGYVKENFYRPLGAYNLTFNAWKEFPLQRIVPTEYDDYFRFSLLHGFVDDEGAAMMGGISGNAGLFSDANDLAKLMQMYLQMGEYGGQRYISEETMSEFTRCQFPENDNRRGLVFDKPLLGNDTLSINECYPAYSASPASFGHSGYTGTFVWCDPKYNLVYIFLSNRVYPTRKNSDIYDTNVRMLIHQGIYDAIKKFEIQNK